MQLCKRRFIASALCVAIPLVVWAPLSANDDQARTIAFYNIHTKETLSIVYKRRGQYQAAAMKRINWVLRDWRRDKPTKMDPKLIDLAWEIHQELGSREPIHVISGYRSPKTNAMLRRTRGGQARRSQHILGKALDMRFPDVPIRRLRYAGLIRERGGVGYYPTSGTPFIHIDTGRVRHWPRMGRYELALLFPNGRTRHNPRRGGPISRRDVIVARRRQPGLAVQVAAYHRDRTSGRRHTIVAAASPRVAIGPFTTSVERVQPPRPRRVARAPSLIEASKLIDRPSRLLPGPSLADRQALTRLAAFASSYSPAATSGEPAQAAQSPGQPLNGPAEQTARLLSATWVSAPGYDEEHPEEMSYRPFPVLPFLTATASPHDPALAKLVHPDVSRTLEFLDHEGSVPPLRLRPGAQTARMLWAQAFSGKAVELGQLTGPAPKPSRFRSQANNLANRRVQTQR